MSAGRDRVRAALQVLEGGAAPAVEVEWSWFCGHCAAASPRSEPPPPHARVCQACGLGLFLETRADAVPERGDAFIVIDDALVVRALSVAAERLLAVSEEEVIEQPVAELVVPADAEALGSSGFAAAVAEVMGQDEPVHAYVRPRNTFGVRMRATIAACGPPRAALVVLDTGPRNLRVV